MIVRFVNIGGTVDHHCFLHNCTVNKIHMFYRFTWDTVYVMENAP